jgi:hypothetical protein
MGMYLAKNDLVGAVRFFLFNNEQEISRKIVLI